MRTKTAGLWLALILVLALRASPAAALNCALSSTGASFGTVPVTSNYPAKTTGTLNLTCSPGQNYVGVLQVCLSGIGSTGVMVSGLGGGALPYTITINAAGKAPLTGACNLTATTNYTSQSGATVAMPLYLKTRTSTVRVPTGSYLDQFVVNASVSTPVGVALASGAANFPVTAGVQTSCALAAPSLAFGEVKAFTATPAMANLVVYCTKALPFHITLDAGQGPGASYAHRYLTSPSDSLSYNLYQDAAHSQVWGAGGYSGAGTGSAQDIAIYGLVDAQKRPLPGVFTDSVIVTLTY